MRFFDEERNTNNSRVYKVSAIYRKLGCPICAPNQGCNSYGKYQSISWKDQSKRKRQWKDL